MRKMFLISRNFHVHAMQHGDINVNYGHAEWTRSTGMQHGQATWTCTMTSSMNMLNGHET
jgi:hypothetical protein